MTTLHPHPDGLERLYAATAVHRGVVYELAALRREERIDIDAVAAAPATPGSDEGSIR